MRRNRALPAALLLLAPSVAEARPLEALQADRAATVAEVRDLDRRTATLDDQLGLRRRTLKRRLRALYKLSEGGAFRLVVDAGTPEELEQRLVATRRVLGRDLQELGTLDDEVAELARDRAVRIAEQARRSKLDDEEAQRAGDEQLAMSTVPVGLEARRGRLPRPVPGSVTIGLGHVRVESRLGGPVPLELPRRAVEMVTTPGEPVRAVAGGVVRWTGEIDGLGLVVLVDHGDRYVTATGHLFRIDVGVGASVAEGATLGIAAGGTISFELTEGRTPLDPLRWLAPPTPPARPPSGKAGTLAR